jgi:hypothetical protein
MKAFIMLMVKCLWTLIFHFIKDKLSNALDVQAQHLVLTLIFYSLKLLLAPYFSPEKCIAVHRSSMNPIRTAWLTIGVRGFVIRVFLLLGGLPFMDYELHLTRALCFKWQTLVYSDQLNLDWWVSTSSFTSLTEGGGTGVMLGAICLWSSLATPVQSPYLKKIYNLVPADQCVLRTLKWLFSNHFC